MQHEGGETAAVIIREKHTAHSIGGSDENSLDCSLISVGPAKQPTSSSHAGTLRHTKRGPDEDHTGKRRIKMERFFKKDQKGFTLIEVMLVVIIIGIIAIIALPKLLVTRTEAAEKSCKSNLQAIRTQLEQYQWINGEYPGHVVDPAVTTVALFLAMPKYFPPDSSISGYCPLGSAAADLYDAGASTDITTGVIECPNHPNN